MSIRQMRTNLRFLLFALLASGLWVTLPLASAGRADSLPPSAYVQGMLGYPQTYTLSCESRSAVDWARFFGVSISESEFLNRLPRSDNPNAGFVGDPNGYWGTTPPNSYGVHAQPVADLLDAYGLEAQAHHGFSWDDLRAEIAAGRPVIVWVIGQMWDGNGFGYTASDGETVRVAAFEHTMILVGYDESWVYALDASTGWTQAYSTGAFLHSWEVLGNMAVTGSRPEEEPAPPPPPPATTGDTYTVQRGDYLVALARQWDLDWQELAALNDIPYPYTLYAGQILKLPERENDPLLEEQPAAEEPVAEEPVAEEPVAEAPVAKAPVPEKSVAEKPPALPKPPAPTPVPETYAFLILTEPRTIHFPLIAQQGAAPVLTAGSDVVAAGVCLFTHNGVVHTKPASYLRGWCISADRIRPEYLLGLAGNLPTLP